MLISYHLVQGSYSITCSHLDIRKAFSERVLSFKKKKKEKSLLKKEAADLEAQLPGCRLEYVCGPGFYLLRKTDRQT